MFSLIDGYVAEFETRHAARKKYRPDFPFLTLEMAQKWRMLYRPEDFDAEKADTDKGFCIFTETRRKNQRFADYLPQPVILLNWSPRQRNLSGFFLFVEFFFTFYYFIREVFRDNNYVTIAGEFVAISWKCAKTVNIKTNKRKECLWNSVQSKSAVLKSATSSRLPCLPAPAR